MHRLKSLSFFSLLNDIHACKRCFKYMCRRREISFYFSQISLSHLRIEMKGKVSLHLQTHNVVNASFFHTLIRKGFFSTPHHSFLLLQPSQSSNSLTFVAKLRVRVSEKYCKISIICAMLSLFLLSPSFSLTLSFSTTKKGENPFFTHGKKKK
jgi:hypothetical protein